MFIKPKKYGKIFSACVLLLKNTDITAASWTRRVPFSAVNYYTSSQLRASSGTSPAKMQAWEIFKYGGNEELTLTDSARAATIKAPNELLIKVHAASVNPIDVRIRGGYGAAMFNILRKKQGEKAKTEFPLTLGRDFSGVVIEAGEAVKKFKPGDEVWGALGVGSRGTHAQFVVASESEISEKPKSLSHIEAASIPYVAGTSWTALCTVGGLEEKNVAGKRILIQGGSGGIGTFSIQLLKAWGADVTTTCSTNAVEFVKSLGADTVVDYKTTNAKEELARLPPFDFVLDAVGGQTADDSFGLLKKWTNAKLVTIVTPLLNNIDSKGLVIGGAQSLLTLGANFMRGLSGWRSYRWALFRPNGNALETVSQLVDGGQIRPLVERKFPFKEVPAAFEHVGSGHSRGKTVVDVTDLN